MNKQKKAIQDLKPSLETCPMIAVALDSRFSKDLTAARGAVAIKTADELKRLLNALFGLLVDGQSEENKMRILGAWLDTPAKVYELQKGGDLFSTDAK